MLMPAGTPLPAHDIIAHHSLQSNAAAATSPKNAKSPTNAQVANFPLLQGLPVDNAAVEQLETPMNRMNLHITGANADLPKANSSNNPRGNMSERALQRSQRGRNIKLNPIVVTGTPSGLFSPVKQPSSLEAQKLPTTFESEGGKKHTTTNVLDVGIAEKSTKRPSAAAPTQSPSPPKHPTTIVNNDSFKNAFLQEQNQSVLLPQELPQELSQQQQPLQQQYQSQRVQRNASSKRAQSAQPIRPSSKQPHFTEIQRDFSEARNNRELEESKEAMVQPEYPSRE
eukprot:gene36221-40975_t